MCIFRKKRDADDFAKKLRSLEGKPEEMRAFLKKAHLENLYDTALTSSKDKKVIIAEIEIELRKEKRSRRNYYTALFTLIVSGIALIMSWTPSTNWGQKNYICTKDNDNITLVEKGFLSKKCTEHVSGDHLINKADFPDGCGWNLNTLTTQGYKCTKTNLKFE